MVKSIKFYDRKFQIPVFECLEFGIFSENYRNNAKWEGE